MNFRATISAQELRRLYLDEHWTQEEIAAHYGCSATTIKRRMVELGLDIRARGPEPGGQFDFKYNNPAWTPGLAYVVGIIATDGNLSPDGRHLCIKSKDRDLVETVRRCLGLENRIGIERKLFSTCYVLAWGNRAFYDWLTTIGLMPAKSLKLGALAVPQEFFPDFLRGAIDGDGSITMYQDRWNASKNPKYVYERLFVRIYSASLPFLQWVQAESVQSLGVAGAIVRGQRKPGASQMWELRFAKKESLQVLPRVYYAPGLPSLERKRNDAKRALLMIGAPD